MFGSLCCIARRKNMTRRLSRGLPKVTVGGLAGQPDRPVSGLFRICESFDVGSDLVAPRAGVWELNGMILR